MLTQEFLGYPVIFWILAIPAYSYTLFNGFLDGGNAVATLIASRAMKPKSALRFTALVELVSPMTLFLTGFGVFDNIAKHAGAGTAVPITGFANSIVSSAMEFHSEGFILGTAANMFKLAGPVIVFGCGSAVVYGLIIYIFGWY